MKDLNPLDYRVVQFNPLQRKAIQKGAFQNGHDAKVFAEDKLKGLGVDAQMIIVKGEIINIYVKEEASKETP